MSSPELLQIVRLTIARHQAAATEALLELLGLSAGRWDKAGEDRTVFELYCRSAAEADTLKTNLQKQLAAVEINGSIQITAVPHRNWQDAWKDFFHVERVSRRIVIKPSHEDYVPRPDDCLIQIDPGMSFGTGQHATTRSCLIFLDELAEKTPQKNRSFLDLGCGSGILSIAAAKLGFSPIGAFDIDPDSVEIANQNFAANGVADCVQAAVGDVAKLELTETYTVTAANILAKVLLPNAAKIASTVRPGGHLLLAGILTEQFNEVSSVYQQLGFSEIKRLSQDEWTSAIFRL